MYTENNSFVFIKSTLYVDCTVVYVYDAVMVDIVYMSKGLSEVYSLTRSTYVL